MVGTGGTIGILRCVGSGQHPTGGGGRAGIAGCVGGRTAPQCGASLNELTQPPAQPRPTFDEVVRHPSTLVDEPALFPESTATPGQITTLTRIDGPPTNQRTPMVRTIPTEIPAEDGGAQVQPAQWPSYDMSPRTSMDVISQRASSAWREVDRFRPAYVASLPSAPAASPLSSPPAQSRTRNAPPARTASSVGILPLPPPPSTHPISSDYLDEELAEIDLKLAEIVLQAARNLEPVDAASADTGGHRRELGRAHPRRGSKATRQDHAVR